MILALAWTFGLSAQRLGYPALRGELVADIIDAQLFSILVFIAVFTTVLVTPTMKW